MDNREHSEIPDDLNIRPMRIEDLNQVMRIEKSVFSHPWPREAFLAYLFSSKPNVYIVAEKQNLLLGYAAAHEKNNKYHLVNMAVKKSWQRTGIGSRLLERIFQLGREKSISEIFLEVRESNQRAIAFYEKHKFIRETLRQNYYTDNNEDAIIMVRSLK